MHKLMVVVKNELLRYFISPVAYVYLISFLILNAVTAFYFGHWFDRGEASLFYMFVYQPWIYMLFLPGIAMRLWAEEFKSKTIIQIMTMPVGLPTLVWGKFLAAWLFALLALVLTFPFVISVNILGTPDNSVIFLSYFAGFVLTGAMLAISQTMSALTKNQVVALVLSVVVNLIFFFSGMEFVLSLFRLIFPDFIVDTIASFSFLTHYNQMISGTIAWKDILFFLSVIILFNFTTMIIVSAKTSGVSFWFKSDSKAYNIIAFCVMLAGFIGFNLLANNMTQDAELDVTQEKFYTLDRNSIDILGQLKEPVTAKLYFSDILAKRNPNFRVMFDRTRMMLAHYKKASRGHFDYRIYHPKNLDTTEDRAIADGLQPIALIDLNQNALFGLSVVDALDNKEVIPYLSFERIQNLEQDLTALIYRLSHKKKTLGVLSSLPIAGQSFEGVVLPQYEILSKISEFYDIHTINQPEDIEKVDILMVIHPQNLGTEMVEAVKNFAIHNGKILMLLDTAAEATRLYMPSNAPYKSSDLSGLDDFFGFRFYPEYVVADLENSITVDATTNYRTNPAYTQDIIQFKSKENNFNPFHPVTKNLHTILMSSASVIMPKEGADISFTPLIQASANSALMSSDVVYENLNPRQILSLFQKDENVKFLAAYIQSRDPNKPFNLIVAGDTDFLYDNFWGSQQLLGAQKYFVPLFNNADFVLNALDYLSSNTSLLNLRGKGAKNRPFENMEKLRKESLFKYKVKEEEIFQTMEQVKDDLREIWGKRDFEDRQNFNADELSIISNIQKKLDTLRLELSTLRAQSLKELDDIALKYKFLNILAVPLVLGLILMLFSLKNTANKQSSNALKLNMQLIKLTVFAFLMLVCGLVSVMLVNSKAVSVYEGKPVLAHLKNKINNVNIIKLQNRETHLTFVKEEGVWHIKEFPDLAVYQERIKSFLSALMEASFYEKKSDKAENLYKFGLAPFEVEGSEKIKIELTDEKQKPIETLEVGKYNIELGRGGSGAYVKFEDKFQVWLVAAEFVDLSLDVHEWTYSHLWNLRFGRLKDINQIKDEDSLLQMMKFLLNTEFFETNDTPQTKDLIQTYTLMTENDEKVILDVYKAGQQYYVSYKIGDDIKNNHLKFFANFVKDKFFKIDSKAWEKQHALGYKENE